MKDRVLVRTMMAAVVMSLLVCSSMAIAQVCPTGYPVNCNNGFCCPSGTTCIAGGKCQNNNSTGLCPIGYPVDCHDGTCCPGGDVCIGGGRCSMQPGGNNNNGCPPGYPVDCNDGTCAPSGSQCCASVGATGKSCPAGSYCVPGGCKSDGGSGSGGSKGCNDVGMGDLSLLGALMLILGFGTLMRRLV